MISHEYGHSLGLPDYYSTGSRETYGAWTLMATDYSQNIDVIGKKELGWLVPRVLEPGQRVAADWEDTKKDTNRIDWKRADGTPYTLSGPTVHNGEAYIANLPGRRLIDPALVPSGTHLWWSGSGNDFGCPPEAGHNLDLALPAVPGRDAEAHAELQVALGRRVGLRLRLRSVDHRRKTYKSYASAKSYTTPASQNPNGSACQTKYGNGITGSSASYAAGTQTVDRLAGNYGAPGFVDDEYDISDLIGKPGAALRFTYATDPGLARPGWFMDDVKIVADGKVIYSSDFENANDPALFNGGCNGSGLQTAAKCTHGWQYVAADQNSPAEHAYLLEMRDRSGFDFKGQGESDRGVFNFQPGVLLAYTDEDHGYGNVGTDDPPAQTPLDARPEPGSDTPNLDDAAFKQGDSYSDAGAGHTDNYAGPDGAANWVLKDDCLSFSVDALQGADVGPELQGRYDMKGTVTFRTTQKCGQFDYGNGAKSDGVPVGDAPAAPPQQSRPAGSARRDRAPRPRSRCSRPRSACKARSGEGPWTAELVPDRLPVVRGEDADGHVPAQEGRPCAGGPASRVQGGQAGAEAARAQGQAHVHAEDRAQGPEGRQLHAAAAGHAGGEDDDAQAAGDTDTLKRALKVSPGATVPGETAGAVIGSKQMTSAIFGAKTCA